MERGLYGEGITRKGDYIGKVIHGKGTHTYRGHTRKGNHAGRGLHGEEMTLGEDYTGRRLHERGLHGEWTTWEEDYTERRLHKERTT